MEKLKVLVVDDRRDPWTASRSSLRADGYEIEKRRTTVSALDIVMPHGPSDIPTS